jgi:two-component system sensor histidine kinase and response regulator WspE
MSFNLLLPLTLSVIRALLVKIGDEPYAFPLAHIDKALFVSENEVRQIDNRRYFNFEGQAIALIAAQQILEETKSQPIETLFPVVVVSDLATQYGVIVETFLGEKELVVHELDPRLGKVADISAGAFMEDGSPLLIVDVEDMVKSIDRHLSERPVTS